MPHGRHIYVKASDMAKATICLYPHSDHALPHWKCVFRCCAKFPSINIPEQDTDDQYSNNILSIRFHVYHLIARCTTFVVQRQVEEVEKRAQDKLRAQGNYKKRRARD